MVRAKETKTTSLILTAVVMVLSVAMPGGCGIGLTAGGSVVGRLLYPFMHVNILHAGMNCWCLLSVVFLYDLPLWTLLASYLVAVCVPAELVPGLTMGMSGICFCLLGMSSWLVQRKLYYNAMAVAFMGMGFLFPNCAAWIHVYCYVLGSGLGLFLCRK